MTDPARARNACLASLAMLAVALLPQSTAGQQARAIEYFGAVKEGSLQPPNPVGSYARGCLAGAVRLPDTGPTWQAMRPSRNRHWGHPVLVEYIVDLSRKAAELGWIGLYVGDMSQPRGGPMTYGHQSHQTGLDVDIWMRPPDRLNLTRAERDEISFVSIRSADQASLSGNWTDTHMQILKAAADNPLVDRIFVTAPAKIYMCKHAGSDRAWLQKIRPLYGHDSHFHVRLRCPAGSTHCRTQTPTVAELSGGGDGCDASLRWWVTVYIDRLKTQPKKPAKPAPGVRAYTMADLPNLCGQVLNSD